MKRMIFILMCLCLVSMASAEMFTLTDNHGGSSYGAANGFGVAIDTTYNSLYDVALVAGQTYKVNSVSIWECSDNATEGTVYLSVFDSTLAGFDGDTSAEHLGFSDNSVNLLASVNGSMVTWTFANSNILVTADSDGLLSGSGLLYFVYDTNTTRNNSSNPTNAYYRMDAGAASNTLGAAVYAYGSLQSTRSPEVIVSLTPVYDNSQTYTVTDGGAGDAYGADGFAVDIDTSFNTYYDTAITAGRIYRIDSVSMYEAENTATRYLSVFNSSFGGFDGDTSAEYLGHSDNAVNMSSANGTLVTWTFSGTEILVMADSDGGISGSGLLYFMGDSDTTRNNNSANGFTYYRMDGDRAPTIFGSQVVAFGGLIGNRVPEVIISLRPVTNAKASSPVPANSAVLELETLTQLSWTDFSDPNLVSIDGYDVVFGTNPDMLLNTTYTDVSKPFDLAGNGIYLDYDTDYYWRVDTHVTWDSNDFTGGASLQDIAIGNQWQFTTLPENLMPVVTADADNLGTLTFLDILPAGLTGAVNDQGEGDIASVTWELLGFEAVPQAMQMIARGLTDSTNSGLTVGQNLAQITSDPNLYVDWIGTDSRSAGDPMELRLKGLPAGTYNWTSFHADPENQHGSFDVTVLDANGKGAATTVEISGNNTLPISTYTATITADGTNDVVLVFDQTPWGGYNANLAFFVMNGFELTKGVNTLKIDFGGVNGLHSTTAGYQFYEADNETAATFTAQSYSAFGTTVSIQPIWGSTALATAAVTDTTNDASSPSQSASFTTDTPGRYVIQLSATDGKPQTDSDTMIVQVQTDACAAAQVAPGWPGFNSYDADTDCDVDLLDFAALALQWLDDRNLAGPIQVE